MRPATRAPPSRRRPRARRRPRPRRSSRTPARPPRRTPRLAATSFRRSRIASRTREEKLNKKEEALDKREANLDKRASTYDQRDQELSRRDEKIKARDQKLDNLEKDLTEKLDKVESDISRVARMSQDEAKQNIIERMTGEAKVEAARMIKNIEEEAIAEADRRAKKVIGIAIQRYAGEYVTEQCVSVVQLPTDEMKGRIIGREGRNIRALEAATGINLIIDDTPEAVILSGFDPVRREVARIALERLIADGRIHPSRIEEVVQKTSQEVDQIIKEAGEQAAFELGLHGIHGELLKLIGRLRYRTSYGQNMWGHSIEVGFLCGMMASELGLNVKKARRAGLLHDIGKALTHEMEGSHALIGGDFCKKYGEDPIVVNAVAAHHEDVPPKSVYAHLVMAGDALSGARPGARREVLQNYVQRLEDLERISSNFDGVEKSYAIQAGREIRVMVEHGRVSDEQAHMLSKDIARKIEEELVYPGQIKVCVIRETRAVDFAR
ncbi:MAG: ribonuclease Y [Myxococcales bacterium]|nr:ribonuclease Y [Myxococcales bacterium]